MFLVVVLLRWRVMKVGKEIQEHHVFETQLNLSRDFAGNLEIIYIIGSCGYFWTFFSSLFLPSLHCWRTKTVSLCSLRNPTPFVSILNGPKPSICMGWAFLSFSFLSFLSFFLYFNGRKMFSFGHKIKYSKI